MGRRGPKPKPTALKVLSGTRKDRINSNEPKPPPGLPEPPEHLDEVALAEWGRMVELLSGLGTLTTADGAALALYCTHYSTWVNANHTLRTEGATIKTDKGGEKTSPYVAIANASARAMERLLAEFGCTPSSRGRGTASKPPSKSALELFLDRRKVD
jgi:P27 family predicted phage terminase small subunit